MSELPAENLLALVERIKWSSPEAKEKALGQVRVLTKNKHPTPASRAAQAKLLAYFKIYEALTRTDEEE
jgi:hypothetical protein